MLNFICTTAVCIQQYLGTGYVSISDRQRFIWDGSNHDYACTHASYVYNCKRIKLPEFFIQR
jgi:hypothetical protein